MKYTAEQVVRRIIAELKDRYGFDAVFVVDDAIFDEIVSEVASIIREHPGAFADNGDEIAARMRYGVKHACPTCGGSGHVDDARQTHPAQPVSVPDGWRHIANEWTDAAINGVQWLRNVEEGISTTDEAICEMLDNFSRIRRETSEMLAAAPTAPAGDAMGEDTALAVFKYPEAAKSAAKFLLTQYDKVPCDGHGVSYCVRCSAVALSRLVLDSLATKERQS